MLSSIALLFPSSLDFAKNPKGNCQPIAYSIMRWSIIFKTCSRFQAFLSIRATLNSKSPMRNWRKFRQEIERSERRLWSHANGYQPNHCRWDFYRIDRKFKLQARAFDDGIQEKNKKTILQISRGGIQRVESRADTSRVNRVRCQPRLIRRRIWEAEWCQHRGWRNGRGRIFSTQNRGSRKPATECQLSGLAILSTPG